MEAPQYVAARVQQAMAEDGRTHELGIRVDIRGDQLFLRGQVSGPGQRERLGQVAHEAAPELHLHNEIQVVEAGEPGEDEHLD
ncbi:BON domain-containing protein [Nonomuraea phyllanthi]|uniref:BON domain-containing protein n=1 Tax=Nonomuraea phyllanthi TaxID=2219224 RepID=A0A5C4WHF1_9ACTN|nr:BON domain-containing protein [Nonomuraea phyllanthi]KAB8193532.1 BON domain-containing protein [Nonomuraea phyllanthi]QFY12274.1 BON domain-containing protein [Nonomuraea phyllanthi]